MSATDSSLAGRIDALLPQSQCRQCGYTGCMPYAQAIAAGKSDIDRCPPGGDAGARALAALLGIAPKPVDPVYGMHKPPALAVINEALCIGCTLCIRVCPVDAIVGATRLMHTVIARDCTGCELCLAPCPVDCIRMVPIVETPTAASLQAAADRARHRHRRHEARRAQRNQEYAAARVVQNGEYELAKQRTVRRAIERARALLVQNKSAKQ